MSERLMSIPLTRFEEPIGQALKTYQEISDNGLVFDPKGASKLRLTPDKSNSARSVTDALFMAEKIGTLYLIAFKPGDGTGDESGYKLSDLQVDSQYSRQTLIVPRNKTGVHHEAHLAIVRHRTEDLHAEPELYAGTFDLVGLDGNNIKKIGELGHPVNEKNTTPLATLTVGYGKGEERFGDPHAVFSGISNAVQVCAFLAISDDVHKKYQSILDGLNPKLPRRLPQGEEKHLLTSFE
jgi:hypothetical protein